MSDYENLSVDIRYMQRQLDDLESSISFLLRIHGYEKKWDHEDNKWVYTKKDSE